jgi:hypothetical protein
MQQSITLLGDLQSMLTTQYHYLNSGDTVLEKMTVVFPVTKCFVLYGLEGSFTCS